MLHSYQLPLQRGTELFPSTTTIPPVVRMHLVLDRDWTGAVSSMQEVAEAMLLDAAGSVRQWLSGQRRCRDLGIVPFVRTQRELPGMTLLFTSYGAQEALDIYVRPPPPLESPDVREDRPDRVGRSTQRRIETENVWLIGTGNADDWPPKWSQNSSGQVVVDPQTLSFTQNDYGPDRTIPDDDPTTITGTGVYLEALEGKVYWEVEIVQIPTRLPPPTPLAALDPGESVTSVVGGKVIAYNSGSGGFSQWPYDPPSYLQPVIGVATADHFDLPTSYTSKKFVSPQLLGRTFSQLWDEHNRPIFVLPHVVDEIVGTSTVWDSGSGYVLKTVVGEVVRVLAGPNPVEDRNPFLSAPLKTAEFGNGIGRGQRFYYTYSLPSGWYSFNDDYPYVVWDNDLWSSYAGEGEAEDFHRVFHDVEGHDVPVAGVLRGGELVEGDGNITEGLWATTGLCDAAGPTFTLEQYVSATHYYGAKVDNARGVLWQNQRWMMPISVGETLYLKEDGNLWWPTLEALVASDELRDPPDPPDSATPVQMAHEAGEFKTTSTTGVIGDNLLPYGTVGHLGPVIKGPTSGFVPDNEPTLDMPGTTDAFWTTVDVGELRVGSIIMIAVDAQSRKIWFGKDGVWAGGGTPHNGGSPTTFLDGVNLEYYPACGYRLGVTWVKMRFGNSQKHGAPSGFRRLGSENDIATVVLEEG